MRGVVFTGGSELELMNFPDPTPGPDEVVIEMKASGMCGSDLHHYRRPKAGGETGGLAAPRAPTTAGPEPRRLVAPGGPPGRPPPAHARPARIGPHPDGARGAGPCAPGLWSAVQGGTRR